MTSTILLLLFSVTFFLYFRLLRRKLQAEKARWEDAREFAEIFFDCERRILAIGDIPLRELKRLKFWNDLVADETAQSDMLALMADYQPGASPDSPIVAECVASERPTSEDRIWQDFKAKHPEIKELMSTAFSAAMMLVTYRNEENGIEMRSMLNRLQWRHESNEIDRVTRVAEACTLAKPLRRRSGLQTA